MKQTTYVVAGAGHAGIAAVHSIMKAFQVESRKSDIRIVLMDKQSVHRRKVLLFKPAVSDEQIDIPLENIFPHHVEFVQGEISFIDGERKQIRYTLPNGTHCCLDYDYLVAAFGSVVRRPKIEQGGIGLADLNSAEQIRRIWRENLRQAAMETDAAERRRKLTLAVAGAGISGIEASAEFAHAMKVEAKQLGLGPNEVRLYLINAQERLFPEGPVKAGRKLEQHLQKMGVTVLHEVKAFQEIDGSLTLSNGKVLRVGLCVWMLGLMPNPKLCQLGLPLTADGHIMVDYSYRVDGMPGVYSIGDCAKICDPVTGRADLKTCKEAAAQAARLGMILRAEREGRPAPMHQAYMEFYCIGLGPGNGFVWTRKWGLDIHLIGKLGWGLRKYTWDLASLLR